jgi:aquaporin TIP
MKLEALVAEFIGTFTLIFVGVGAIAVAGDTVNAHSGLVGIALAHGLAIAVMVSATAAVSGGHLNPAVTFGALLGGKIKPIPAVGYVIAQCLGAIAAALLIQRAMPLILLQDPKISLGLPALGHFNIAPGKVELVTPWMGVLMEAVLTFFLVFVVFGTGIDRRGPKVGGLFIGLVIVMDILIGGPITGAAMNPARHLGPAVVSSIYDNTWVYWVGPLLGGGLAGLVYKYVMEADLPKA